MRHKIPGMVLLPNTDSLPLRMVLRIFKQGLKVNLILFFKLLSFVEYAVCFGCWRVNLQCYSVLQEQKLLLSLRSDREIVLRVFLTFMPGSPARPGCPIEPGGPWKKRKKKIKEKTHCNEVESKIKDIIPLAEPSWDSRALVAMQLLPRSWLRVRSIKEAQYPLMPGSWEGSAHLSLLLSPQPCGSSPASSAKHLSLTPSSPSAF